MSFDPDQRCIGEHHQAGAHAGGAEPFAPTRKGSAAQSSPDDDEGSRNYEARASQQKWWKCFAGDLDAEICRAPDQVYDQEREQDQGVTPGGGLITRRSMQGSSR